MLPEKWPKLVTLQLLAKQHRCVTTVPIADRLNCLNRFRVKFPRMECPKEFTRKGVKKKKEWEPIPNVRACGLAK